MQDPVTVPFHEAIPRYHQIAQVLRQRAAAGELGGAAGFTEQALCDEFGVSRTTIRQALGMLKRDGVLQSRRGVGTRLVESEPKSLPYTRSSGDPLHFALGTRPRILAVAKVEPPPEVAAFLRLAPGEPALKIERAHDLGGEPLSLVISYVPVFLATKFTRAALKDRSIYELLWAHFGLAQKKSVHTIRVARADGTLASHLGIALADPVLHIRSLANLTDERPIRWTDNYFREDRYQYTAEMSWKKPK
jgi:DNA-binding GntR family transcriptional regulator